VLPYFRPDGRGGFWEINSASHVDAPQQFRLIELMDNGDGTLSLFGTVLDHASPVAPPRPGTPGARMTHRQLASIGRFLPSTRRKSSVGRRGRTESARTRTWSSSSATLGAHGERRSNGARADPETADSRERRRLLAWKGHAPGRLG
jgi:hypothetical protein